MYIIAEASTGNAPFSLSTVEATLLLANTKFATAKFSLRTDISAACSAMVLDLFDLKMVNLVFVMTDGVIDLRDPATFKRLESSSPTELAYHLSVVPLQYVNYRCPQPHKELHKQMLRFAYLSPTVIIPILLKEFLLCGKTTVYINYILNDCTAWVYEELMEKSVINEKSAFLLFRTFELSDTGKQLALYVYTTARAIIEQNYIKITRDFEQFYTEETQRRIYFATLLLATCGFNWLTASTKISPDTYNKFETKLDTMKKNLGAIARLPDLRLQPEGYLAADVALCIGVCASLEQSLAEESRLY